MPEAGAAVVRMRFDGAAASERVRLPACAGVGCCGQVEKVEAQLSQAAAARAAAEQALKQALAGVSEAQAKVKAARK